MAGTKLSADEQAFFDNPPDDAPLDEVTSDRTPQEEPLEEAGGEVEKKPEAEAKKPDAKDDKGKEPAKDGKKPKSEKPTTVPFGTFETERHQRRAAEEALRKKEADWVERQARLDERLSIINEALAPKPEAPPNPDEDIFGYVQHLEAQLNELRGGVTEQRQKTEQQQQQQTRLTQLKNAYAADAMDFAEETPDFKAAYDFLIASRQKELRLLPAYKNNHTALRQAIEADELAIVQSALEANESPAAVIYAIAGARGYVAKQPEGQGGTEPPVEVVKKPEEKPAPNGGDKIDELTKRRDAAVSLSDGGGSPGGEKITLEAIDRMKPDEFKAFVARLNKKEHRGYDRLMERLMVGG